MGEDWFIGQHIDLPPHVHPSIDVGNLMTSADSQQGLALDILLEDNSISRGGPKALLQWFEKANLDRQDKNMASWTCEYPSHPMQESSSMPVSDWTIDSMQSSGSETTLLPRMGSVHTANIMSQNVASNMQAIPQEWCERDMPCSVYETAYPEDWQDGHIRAFDTNRSNFTRREANWRSPSVQVPSFLPLPHPAFSWSPQHGDAKRNTGTVENVIYSNPTVQMCHTLLKPQRDSIINLETASTASTVSARDLSGNMHHYFLEFLVKILSYCAR
ncbi:hypothetical protein BJ912DRAFT_1047160 [Pholiota molesta]|nr:hypothetical protein BJ912DRAFT_1047160 [Pholiota molesta]